MGDGPELDEALLARLGKRHDVPLHLGDFDVIFSVKVETPNHINLEEGAAMLRYLRWILRAGHRFRHRVVLLVDSKVVLGAITKGRSSSRPLNALIRKAAALCFAGGLVLHCVFISTKHNPADWPSRGDAKSWPAALRRRTHRKAAHPRCPDCGRLPAHHPERLPRRMRGQLGSKFNCCGGPAGGFAFDYDACKWEPYWVWVARYADEIDKETDNPSGFWAALAGGSSD